jgi:uncharacterized protein (UPF0212 family)
MGMNTGTRPTARLSWSLYVDCPKCDESFDVVDVDSDSDNIIAMKIFNNKWDEVPGCGLTCPHCEHEFEIGVVDY